MPYEGKIEISGKTVQQEYPGQKLVEVKDKNGFPFMLQEFEGVFYPSMFNPENLKAIKTFPMKKDDVYFTGYPRTGTHWTYEIISMLLNGKAETIQHLKHHIEFVDLEDIKQLPSPRIVHAHMRLSDSPKGISDLKTKVVYTVRDPKDVAVSCYRVYYPMIYNDSFEVYFDLFLQGKVNISSFLDHIRDAEKFHEDNPDVPFHFQIYEDTIKDPVLAVQKLSDFLGLKRDDQLCRDIAEKCHISKMSVDKKDYALTYNGENLLYRQGKTGDWRNHFTEEMLDEYYRVYEEKMAGSRFYHRYAREKL